VRKSCEIRKASTNRTRAANSSRVEFMLVEQRIYVSRIFLSFLYYSCVCINPFIYIYIYIYLLILIDRFYPFIFTRVRRCGVIRKKTRSSSFDQQSIPFISLSQPWLVYSSECPIEAVNLILSCSENFSYRKNTIPMKLCFRKDKLSQHAIWIILIQSIMTIRKHLFNLFYS